MRKLKRLTRILVVTLMIGAMLGVGMKPLAQTTPDASRKQRLRRVSNAPNVPSSTNAQRPSGPTETPAVAQQEDDDEVVRVNTDLTNILLTAIDKERRFVTSLRREDLRVTENGTAQEISIFERETELPLSLAILIDTSVSQLGVLPDEQKAANTFLDAVIRPEKDQAAVVSFTGFSQLEQPLTNEVAKLHSAIERVQVMPMPDEDAEEEAGATPVSKQEKEGRRLRASTGVWDAIWGTINEILSQTPERTRRAVILLSDGDDTSSETGKQEAIDFAVKHNVMVYSIGIRDEAFPEGGLKTGTLRKVSEQTGGRAFFPQNEAELRAAFAQIQDELRSQYLVAYSPTNKQRDGSYRQVRIEVVNPELRKQKLTLLYRQGYYAIKHPAKP